MQDDKVRMFRPSGVPRQGKYGKGVKTKVVRVPENAADNIAQILEKFEQIKEFIDSWDKTIQDASEGRREGVGDTQR